MSNVPLVSIIVPVYNGEKYLKEAITSVISQTFQDWELLIIDDGSTDHSGEIISEFAKIEPRIRPVKNETNLGLQITLNKGLQMANGSLIARLDSDDRWSEPRKLELQVKFLTDNPDYALVGTRVRAIDQYGNTIGIIDLPRTDSEIRERILLCNCFVHSAVLFRKNSAFKCDLYRVEEKYMEDYGLWLRLGEKFKFANLEVVAVDLRRHPGAISFKAKVRMPVNSFKLILRHARFYPHGAFAITRAALRIAKEVVKTILYRLRHI